MRSFITKEQVIVALAKDAGLPVSRIRPGSIRIKKGPNGKKAYLGVIEN